MGALLTLTLKDLRLLWRDKGGLFWVIGFPVLMAVLFGSIFGGPGEGGAGRMRIAVIDRDGSKTSRAFTERLRKSEALSVETLPEAEARNRVRRGDLVAFVVVPKGFGGAPFMFGDQELEVGIDPSRRAEAGYLQGLLTEASFASTTELFQDPAKLRAEMQRTRALVALDPTLGGEDKRNLTQLFSAVESYYGTSTGRSSGGREMAGPSIRSVPVTRQETGPRSAYEVSFPQAIIWGLLSAAATFALSIVRERTGGTLLRLRVAPLSAAQVLVGKGIACFLACSLVSAALLALGKAVFGVRLGNPTLLAAAIASAAVCFAGLTMLVSVMGRTEQTVGSASWGTLLLMAMFGGGMVPLIAMPQWMLSLSTVSPVRWAVWSLEGAIWRGFSVGEMLPALAILLGVGVVSFAVGARIFLARRD